MREIKFRGWDVGFKEMESWESLLTSDVLPEVLQGLFPNLKIMQYTGLKDKNSVEIYEGDILFHPLQGKRKVFYPYSETVASYGLRNIDNGMGSTLQDAHRVWEIIGNIYENPELLEEANG